MMNYPMSYLLMRDNRDMRDMRDNRDNRDMRDYADYNDGRNPYGSKGGYVSSSRRGRDRADGGDYADYRDYADNRGYGDRESDSRDNYSSYPRYNHTRSGRDYERGDQRGGDYGYPFMVRGEIDMRSDMARGDGHYGYHQPFYMDRGDMRDYSGKEYYIRSRDAMDYGMDSRRDYGDYDMRDSRDYRDYNKKKQYLTDKEIEHWSEKLKREVEEKDKQFFTKEHIKKRAEEMGIKFDKFNLEEFYVTVLMMYTDYCKTLGTANMDIYLRLAKDWLCDEDIAVKYGEKLSAYHDYIVEGK